jgi:hypothetical protein
MGLTTDPNGKPHSLYAAFAQTGFQKFLHNVFQARPHYFNYASPGLGGGTIDVGLLPVLPIPGSTSGVEFSLRFAEPVLSLFPNPAFPTPPGPIVKNQFGLDLKMTICIVTGTQQLSLRVRELHQRMRVNAALPQLQCADIAVLALGSTTTQNSGADKLIGLWANQVTISGTGNLDPLISYIAQLALNALLDKLQLSTNNLAQGAFPIAFEFGPQIDNTQLQIWAGLV